jgi:hypothetical protein
MCRIRAQTRSHCKHSFCQTQAHDTEIVAAAIYKPIPCNHISILPRMHHIELNHLSIKSLIRHLTRERERERDTSRFVIHSRNLLSKCWLMLKGVTIQQGSWLHQKELSTALHILVNSPSNQGTLISDMGSNDQVPFFIIIAAAPRK